jgi:hypothetical protein
VLCTGHFANINMEDLKMSQLPKRKEAPDGYRPVTIPKAVKMINRRKIIERNEQEMINSVQVMDSFTRFIKRN